MSDKQYVYQVQTSWVWLGGEIWSPVSTKSDDFCNTLDGAEAKMSRYERKSRIVRFELGEPEVILENKEE